MKTRVLVEEDKPSGISKFFKKLPYKAGGIFRFFRKRYKSYEHIFQLLGGFLGFAVAIALLVGGIAAVPFTGGGSLIPAWVGWIIFVGSVTTTTLAFGRFFGITIDTLLNEQKPNNEKLATAIGFVFAMVFAALVAPLAGAIAPFVNTTVYKNLWVTVLLFFISTVQQIASIGRHIGRPTDKHFDQKTLPDRIEKIYRYIKVDIFGFKDEEQKEDITPDMSDQVRVSIKNANQGITDYLQLPREDKSSHLGFFSRVFDHKAGRRRANTYLTLLRGMEAKEAKRNAKEKEMAQLRGEVEPREVNLNLQKATILYTMLGSGEGEKLKTMVSNAMGYGNEEDPVEAARKSMEKYIRQQLPQKDHREKLQRKVITTLGLYCDNSKRIYKDKKGDQKEEVKRLNKDNTTLNCAEMREEYDDIWGKLNNVRFKKWS